jgi:probable HAF family extracellular repeat protein
MQSKALVCCVVALLTVLALPAGMTAQDVRVQPHLYHHYQIADPGTFGGPQNGLQAPFYPRTGVLNNQSTLVGAADTSNIDPLCLNHPPDCYASHAFAWQNGTTTDLGILPGGTNSQVNWISANGLMTGVGDIDQADPLIGIPFQIHGTFWGHGGAITDVGALPGTYFSNPIAVNNRGEVVGAAMNTIPDPNSIWGIGYQTRAFYWKNGTMQDLGTVGTGTDAVAALINQQGQVAGWSYTNSTPSNICNLWNFGFLLTTRSFIWDPQNGMRDIGGLGGSCTIATDLNNRGQIVGISALTGDLVLHPFVWDAATGMSDLPGAFAGGSAVFSTTINEHGVVAGSICGPGLPGDCHAFLWQKAGGKWKKTNLGKGSVPTSINTREQVIGYGNIPFLWEDGGPWVDLNTLVPPNSGITLYETTHINDRGEIAVQGPDVNGNNHAVLLIPCDENHPGVEGCDYSLVDAATAAAQSTARPYVSSTTQNLSRSRWSDRYPMRSLQSPSR